MRNLWMIPVALALPLCGCQGFQYAMENYKGVKTQHYYYVPNDGKPRYQAVMDGSKGQTRQVDRAVEYRIFDKPEENRLMITPSLGAAAGMGFARGISLGTVNTGMSPAALREPVEAFLRDSGRICTTGTIDLVGEPQYEVHYTCQSAPTVTGTVPAN